MVHRHRPGRGAALRGQGGCGDAGLHLVLGLPPHTDDAAVAQAALRAGISTRPLSLYHLRQPAASKGLLLGYGAVPEEEIGPSFARLAQVVRGFL